ncbi:RraA family protein [Lacrimispora sp. NSJ-141]|uniref:Putative 4-hydroxy-4-methyl-2-oxoglutarate aldolase n=1 Tax=Lientehia hominis TaxID=2897778 RepID=A0AAP2W9J4_9FIRM|nr:RraA family protein [Lientehia hominis]MCD2491997.1 RraA family protein [Lientehia hominis]
MNQEKMAELKKILYSGILCDVLDGMGYRNQSIGMEIRPLMEDTVIFGPAFTSIGTEVYSMPENPLIAQCKVVDQIKEGEIYILKTRGEYNCAVFGELFATAVQKRGGAGVLLDGLARDLKELKKMQFPLFYRGTSPKTSKGRCEINECQIPVEIGGVNIRPGDYIFGDADGIVVIPAEVSEEVFEKSIETIEKENMVRDGLINGQSLEHVYTEIGAI